MRQKVRNHFLPVQSAKKGKRSLPFFGVKARQPTTHLHDPVGAHCVRPYDRADRAGFALIFNGFEARLCLVSNPKITRQKVGFYFLTFP
jgi:hypothetical protein